MILVTARSGIPVNPDDPLMDIVCDSDSSTRAFRAGFTIHQLK